MSPDGGYVRLYRRIWDNPIFRTGQEAAVFAWMVSTAQWREATINTQHGPVRLFPGEIIVAEREIAARFCLDRNAVQRLLKRMIRASMISADRERVTSRLGAIVAVVNYREYQGVSADSSGTVSQLQASPEPDVSPKQAKNKEENPGRQEREKASPSREAAGDPGAGDLLATAAVLRMPPDAVDAAVAAWNALARDCDLSRVEKVTPARRSSLRLRLRECGGLNGWHAALEMVRSNPFLLGDGERGWKADFDFMLKAKSFTRLREGVYANRGAGKPREAAGSVAWMAKYMRPSAQGGEATAFDLDLTADEAP